jgi:katanin p60 ATPase-containing subunit A1
MSASTLISKWRGESEKLIRVLFELAKYHEPSIIFFDELDSLTSKRSSVTEHEATKRLKNEFLSILDGLESGDNKVFVLGSTNLPWYELISFFSPFNNCCSLWI